MNQVHELMFLRFTEGIGEGHQLLVMEALHHQLSAQLEDDSLAAELFACFEERTVSYMRGVRIGPRGSATCPGEVASP
jgi:hypothetical protein